MEAIENKKALAEFLGLEEIQRLSKYNINIYNFISQSEIINTYQFDRDWNWLMTVVEKINTIMLGSPEIRILGNRVELFYWIISEGKDRSHQETTSEEKSLIQAVYNCCVIFINWYNKQHNQNF